MSRRHSEKGFFQQAILCLEKIDENDFKEFTDAVSAATGCKGKPLFMSLRAALSGEVHGEGWTSEWKRGPQLAALWDFLGAKRIMRRLVLAESNCD